MVSAGREPVFHGVQAVPVSLIFVVNVSGERFAQRESATVIHLEESGTQEGVRFKLAGSLRADFADSRSADHLQNSFFSR